MATNSKYSRFLPGTFAPMYLCGNYLVLVIEQGRVRRSPHTKSWCESRASCWPNHQPSDAICLPQIALLLQHRYLDPVAVLGLVLSILPASQERVARW